MPKFILIVQPCQARKGCSL